MIVKAAAPEDLPQLKEIWMEAFGDSEIFIDGFFSTGFSCDRSRCVRLGNRVVAALYWFDCFLEGEKLAYIYAVATDKAYRGRGLCRSLMEDTHRHLRSLGYLAAVLVPGNEQLFSMYASMAYLPFCNMETVTVSRGVSPVPVEKISHGEYFRLRPGKLSPKGICQDSATEYLQTFTQCYRTEHSLFCMSREGDTLLFQEFLGDPQELPGVVREMGTKTAIVRVPGKKPCAMYLPLGDIRLENAYFGISLG